MTRTIEYIECTDCDGFSLITYYKKLNRTGKCKITTGPCGTKEYVQHKGLFFKSWIPVEQIVEADERTLQVYDCKKGV